MTKDGIWNGISSDEEENQQMCVFIFVEHRLWVIQAISAIQRLILHLRLRYAT